MIFHCAGKSGPQDSNASPIDDLDVNVRGLLVLLETCKEVASTARVVFPSSRLVYAAETSIPVSEDAPTFPNSAYGVHKLAAERHLLLYRRLYGIGAVVLRITNPYGPFHRPGESRYGIVNWFIQRAVRGESIPIYGTGDQLRDYIHIDDVVEAMMVAGIHDRADGEILNIASGIGIRIRELAELIVSAAGKTAVVHVPWPDNARQVETGDFVADVSRARVLLQWSPRIGLRDGIRNVVAECGAAEWER